MGAGCHILVAGRNHLFLTDGANACAVVYCMSRRLFQSVTAYHAGYTCRTGRFAGYVAGSRTYFLFTNSAEHRLCAGTFRRCVTKSGSKLDTADFADLSSGTGWLRAGGMSDRIGKPGTGVHAARGVGTGYHRGRSMADGVCQYLTALGADLRLRAGSFCAGRVFVFPAAG